MFHGRWARSVWPRYMDETGRELWIPLYPLDPDHDILDEVGMLCNLHRRMLGRYAAEDDYTGFPKIIMYFGGDEIFVAEAPEYEKAFRRCGVKDYTVHVEPGLFHGYPMFFFVKEGRRGEDEIIGYLKQ